MRTQKTRLWLVLSVALLVVATAGLPEAGAQSLAEVARETKKKKEQSTRTVLTNEDLGGRGSFPEIRLLGVPREHPPSLAVYSGGSAADAAGGRSPTGRGGD
jgi:hypothetical protein